MKLKTSYRGTRLLDAWLVSANLDYQDLSGMDLSGASLRFASLRHADLRGCNLSRCDLRQVDLTGADITGAVLDSPFIEGTDFDDVVRVDGRLPEEASQLNLVERSYKVDIEVKVALSASFTRTVEVFAISSDDAKSMATSVTETDVDLDEIGATTEIGDVSASALAVRLS